MRTAFLRGRKRNAYGIGPGDVINGERDREHVLEDAC
jgi:hypothetical protein